MPLMRTPRNVDIEITGKCNLRCLYCSHFSSPGDVDDELSTDEWLQFFEELKQASVMKVSLQGGEPFFRKDIRQLISGIVINKMRFEILSNGTFLTDDLADFLKSTGRCNWVQLSLDGSTPHIHESSRGSGTFFETLRAVKILRNHKIPCSIRVTLHKKNVKHLPELTEFILDELEIPGFSINSVNHMGLCQKNTKTLQLSIPERIHAMETLLKLDQTYPGRIAASSGPLWEAKTWNQMDRAYRKKEESFPNGGALTACGCIMKALGVRADGIIVPCLLLGHIELGRINRDDFVGIWQEHNELKRLRKRSQIPLSDFHSCKHCVYSGYCSGNCPASAYAFVGEDQHPDPASCLKRFFQKGGKLPNAPAFSTTHTVMYKEDKIS